MYFSFGGFNLVHKAGLDLQGSSMDWIHKSDPRSIKVVHGLGLYGWSMDGIIYKSSPRYNLQPGQGSMIDQ